LGGKTPESIFFGGKMSSIQASEVKKYAWHVRPELDQV